MWFLGFRQMNAAKFDESQIKSSVNFWRSKPEGTGGKNFSQVKKIKSFAFNKYFKH